ncbi:MAG: tRNA pseudouridine(38-40) synthase TruA [Alphaproteobacteria bacterium]
MTRYKLTLEYDGGPFVGWQRQASGLSIQGVLEQAIDAFSGQRTEVIGAGRTDAGVHATGQVAHFDLERERPARVVRDGLNHHLRPHPIVVLSAEAAGDDFHARFSAIGRRYRYRILNRRAPAALERGHTWWVPVPLDADAMASAATILVGEHDFTTFRASDCQARSPVKALDRLEVVRDGDEIRIDAKARSFLHRQVRNIVGSLKLVGAGKWSTGDMRAALEARDRRAGGPTAPASGLCLVSVEYP